MSTEIKPLILWGTGAGPNPWKVAFVLDELKIAYELILHPFDQLKKAPYVDLCVNGRAPALEDPNTGITLWESGAILEYIVETYDKDKKLSFEASTPDYFLAKQWLHFQVSGQGPYFGQALWFTKYHPEPLQSAKDRYVKEVRRVTGVLDRALQGKDYLVGDKFSYADAAFLPWYLLGFFPWYDRVTPGAFVQFIALDEFPNTSAWLRRIRERPIIAQSLEAMFDRLEKHVE